MPSNSVSAGILLLLNAPFAGRAPARQEPPGRDAVEQAAPLEVAAQPESEVQTKVPTHVGALIGADSPSATRFTSFKRNDGLPSLNVNVLAHAPDGLLWVGTGGGCVTFDGNRFKSIGPARDRCHGTPDSNALEVKRVEDLVVDRSGFVWVAGPDGMLLRYPDESSAPTRVPTRQSYLTCLLEGDDGHVWVGGDRLERVEVRNGEPHVITVLESGDGQPLRITSMAKTPLTDTLQRPEGTPGHAVFIASNQGLHRWSAADGFEQLDTRPRSAVFFDGDHHRWELIDSTTFLRNGEAVETWPSPLGELRVAERLIDGATAIGFDEALLLHRPGANELIRVPVSGSPKSILSEPDAGVWIASEPLGLQYIEPKDYYYVPTGLQHNLGDTLAQLGPTTLLLGSTASSLPRTLEYTAAGPKDVKITPLEAPDPLEGVFDAQTASDGTAYLATGRGIILLGEPGNAAPPAESDLRIIFDGRSVKHLCAGVDGAVWADLSDGLHELVGGVPTGRTLTEFGGHFATLSSRQEVIVAVRDRKVVSFNTRTGVTAELAYLPDVEIRALHQDDDQAVWITTYGSGLFRSRPDAEGRAAHLDRWSTKRGLPDRFLGWIGTVPGPTSETHLWVNSSSGAIAIERASLERAVEDPNARLECWTKESAEANGIDGVAMESGHLALPTMRGIHVIDTHEPLTRAKPPRLSLAGIWGKATLLGASATLAGASDLDFEFDAVSMPASRRGIVEYRLRGHNDTWTRAGDERVARYMSLPPGEYTFELRGHAVGTDSGSFLRSQVVTIVPHWYQSLAFRLLLGASIAGCAVYLVRQRLQSAEAKGERLQLEMESQQHITRLRRQLSEAEENERARIARELHDDFSQRIAAVALGLERLGSGSDALDDEAFGETVCTIQTAISGLAHEIHGLSRRLHPTVLDDLGLTAALRSECAQRAEHASFRVDFQHDGSAKNLKGEVGLAIFRIVQEALQNVAAHANATTAQVRLHTVDESLVLDVIDDGSGLSVDAPHGPGIGLVSMSERAQLVGGLFAVGRREEGGTRVRVIIPHSPKKERRPVSSGAPNPAGYHATRG